MARLDRARARFGHFPLTIKARLQAVFIREYSCVHIPPKVMWAAQRDGWKIDLSFAHDRFDFGFCHAWLDPFEVFPLRIPFGKAGIENENYQYQPKAKAQSRSLQKCPHFSNVPFVAGDLTNDLITMQPRPAPFLQRYFK